MSGYKYSRIPSEPSAGEPSASSHISTHYPPKRYYSMSTLNDAYAAKLDPKIDDPDTKDWADGQEDGVDASYEGSRPTEDELNGPQKLRRVSDNVCVPHLCAETRLRAELRRV